MQKVSICLLITFLVFPSFTMQPESVSTLVGDNIVLQCTANGFPTPDVKWQDSDVFSERVVVYTNGTLVINNATVNDSGKYICLASNIAGVSKIQVNVKVNIRTGKKDDNCYVLVVAKLLCIVDMG